IKGASWRNVGFDQTDDHPVICVSWTDAAEFCKWLGGKAGRTVRLPTEAQWEYACRAGSTTAWSWGDDPDAGKGHCNAADRTGKAKFRSWGIFKWEDGWVFTAPVGKYKPNAFGLHDMHGNVWEWCRDWYRKDYSTAGKLDTKGPYSGALRVVRGGSWLSPPDRCRSAFRTASDPMGSYCDFIIGFRVVADTAPRAEADKAGKRP
ncbi:MAG: SUMF1/EgtB/PvdO family nonheme iron enzyme, partial [Phycisphaerae bacterium]